MMYHIETNSGVIEFDVNYIEKRSLKKYFADRGEKKPLPVKVRGWPFECMYLVSGDEENGQFVAVRPK